jgi:sugar-phosphatase
VTSGEVALSCSAILLDLDGVLVESGRTVERSWRGWAARHGVPEAVVLRLCHGRTSAETIAAAAPHLDAAAEADRIEREQAADTTELAACAGAAELLSTLPRGYWAVVTSGGRALATARLRAVGLPVPAVLVAAGDVHRGKPDPAGYLAAAGRLGVPPDECVVVEDARAGVLAALAAGCRVIGVAGDQLGPATDVQVVIGSLADVTVHRGGRTVEVRCRVAAGV